MNCADDAGEVGEDVWRGAGFHKGCRLWVTTKLGLNVNWVEIHKKMKGVLRTYQKDEKR